MADITKDMLIAAGWLTEDGRVAWSEMWAEYFEKRRRQVTDEAPLVIDGNAYCSPDCLDVNGGPCDTDGSGPCLDPLVSDGSREAT